MLEELPSAHNLREPADCIAQAASTPRFVTKKLLAAGTNEFRHDNNETDDEEEDG